MEWNANDNNYCTISYTNLTKPRLSAHIHYTHRTTSYILIFLGLFVCLFVGLLVSLWYLAVISSLDNDLK